MISKVPALAKILEWAETCDLDGKDFIGEDLVKFAVGDALSDSQVDLINSSMWGFLANCVSADAENVFEAAGQNCGIDAWRRLVRQIDHGRNIRLESLRGEVRLLHTMTIKDLDGIEAGVAQFEKILYEKIMCFHK